MCLHDIRETTILFCGLFCPDCWCSTSFYPEHAGGSAVICNNDRCLKAACLSLAAETFITRDQVIAMRSTNHE